MDKRFPNFVCIREFILKKITLLKYNYHNLIVIFIFRNAWFLQKNIL